ncbi:MAG: hypothetical protein LBM93_05830 [Oscillospiraceae bacterium]|jgi:hypothetical protein|nr:hypothetical protein [Oscillospiraceae bacterium]
MIVPFIFEMSTISNGLLEPHYYAEAVNMVKDKNAPMIIQEKYNLLPSENKDIELFDTNNPTVKAYFNYTSFTDEDVKKVERYIIPQTFEDYIIEEKGGINNAFISLIKERNTELEKILEEIILKII